MKHFDHVLHNNHILNHIVLFEKSSAWKLRGNAETACVTPDLHAKPVDCLQEFKALTTLCGIFTFGIFNRHPQIYNSVLWAYAENLMLNNQQQHNKVTSPSKTSFTPVTFTSSIRSSYNLLSVQWISVGYGFCGSCNTKIMYWTSHSVPTYHIWSLGNRKYFC